MCRFTLQMAATASDRPGGARSLLLLPLGLAGSKRVARPALLSQARRRWPAQASQIRAAAAAQWNRGGGRACVTAWPVGAASGSSAL